MAPNVMRLRPILWHAHESWVEHIDLLQPTPTPAKRSRRVRQPAPALASLAQPQALSLDALSEPQQVRIEVWVGQLRPTGVLHDDFGRLRSLLGDLLLRELPSATEIFAAVIKGLARYIAALLRMIALVLSVCALAASAALALLLRALAQLTEWTVGLAVCSRDSLTLSQRWITWWFRRYVCVHNTYAHTTHTLTHSHSRARSHCTLTHRTRHHAHNTRAPTQHTRTQL